jgi:hypothetical protein
MKCNTDPILVLNRRTLTISYKTLQELDLLSRRSALNSLTSTDSGHQIRTFPIPHGTRKMKLFLSTAEDVGNGTVGQVQGDQHTVYLPLRAYFMRLLGYFPMLYVIEDVEEV